MSQAWTKYLPTFLRNRLDANPVLRKVLGNTSWLLVDRMLRMGVGLLIGVWVSRYLGPEQYGLYSYLLAIVALLAPFASLGLDSVVVRDLVSSPRPASQILGTAFTLKVAGSLLTLAIAVLAITLLHPESPNEQILIAIIAAGTLVQSFDVVDLWFQSRTLSRYTVYAKGVAFLVGTALRVLLIFSHAPLLIFVWVAFAEIVIGSLGSSFAFWRKAMPLTDWRPNRSEASRLLKTSWPLLFSGIAVMIYMKLDIVMLTQMQGAAATGLYAAAVRLSEVWYFIPMAIVTSVSPTIIAAKHEDERLYYSRLRRLFVLMSRLGLALALPISFLAGPIISLLFGSEYSAAGPVLSIHIWSAVFVFFGVAQGCWDVAENFTGFFLFRTISGAVINVVLNLILIPPLGAVGAAISTAVAQACAAWLLNLLTPKSRPIFLMQTRALIPFSERLFRRTLTEL